MQSQYPLLDEWITKMWFMYTMKYYSVLERKTILTYAAAAKSLQLCLTLCDPIDGSLSLVNAALLSGLAILCVVAVWDSTGKEPKNL